MTEKITTNQLEEKLLAREMKVLCDGLAKISKEILDLFAKYGKMEGNFADELQKFLIEQMRFAEHKYYPGYKTEPRVYTHPNWIPELLKKAILKWAVDNFIEQVKDIQEITCPPDF